MLACTNSPAQAHAQRPFLIKFGVPSIIFIGAAFKPQDRNQHSQTQTFVELGLLGLG